MIKVATWNVNSLKVRLPQVLDWMESEAIHTLALQETKIQDADFPIEDFYSRGYEVVFSGQKTYNGVALISQSKITEVAFDIPTLDGKQRRLLAATIDGVRFINLYIPNGAAVDSDKYGYKMHWLQQVIAYIKEQMAQYPLLAVLGDFNIAPADIDVHDPLAWEGQVLVSPAERKAFASLLDLGLQDSFRSKQPEAVFYSWWDYRAGSFRRNRGLRIDHILLSPALNERCSAAGIDAAPRKADRPSDHTPVWVII